MVLQDLVFSSVWHTRIPGLRFENVIPDELWLDADSYHLFAKALLLFATLLRKAFQPNFPKA